MILSKVFSFYRAALSPDTGAFRVWFPYGCCRFYPTCSRYAQETITRRGFFAALPAIAWRLLRCNPWSAGGVDLVYPGQISKPIIPIISE